MESQTSTLNIRQLIFAQNYLLGQNATEAYRKAGYRARAGSLRANASRLLTNANVSDYVGKRQDAIVEKFALKEEQVISELKLIAFSDITDYLTFGPEGVTLLDSSLIAPGKTRAIAHLSHPGTGVGTLSVRVFDKIRALTLLGRYLNLFVCPRCRQQSPGKWDRECSAGPRFEYRTMPDEGGTSL